MSCPSSIIGSGRSSASTSAWLMPSLMVSVVVLVVVVTRSPGADRR